MADICFRTNAFPTDPEGDLEYCNGMPGSQLAKWVRAALLDKGYACREPMQEDYGWGCWIDADGCSIWVSVSYVAPAEGQAAGVPEWHVGVDHDFPPWALRQWLRRRQGRDLVRKIFLIVQELIVSHPGVIVQEQHESG
jgi:hypothetical protein